MSKSTNYQPFAARLVMGSVSNLNTNDQNGNPEPDEKKHHWFMGFVVPKGPEWDKIWNTMYQAAAGDITCGEARAKAPTFHWKIEDCDNPTKPEKKGTDAYPAGHMLIKFTRMLSVGPVKVFESVNGIHTEFNPLRIKEIKLGDHFFIAGSTAFNGRQDGSAGVYQNVNGLMFDRAGVEIVSASTFDPAAAFAGLGGSVTTPAPGATAPSFTAATPPATQAATTPPPPNTDILSAPVIAPKYNLTAKATTDGVTCDVIDNWIATTPHTVETLTAAGYIS